MYDNLEHFHNSDRFPSRDTLQWLNSLEKVKTITADYTVLPDDDILIVNTSGGAIVLNLPPTRNGRRLYVYLKVAGNNLTITPNGSEKIMNAANKVISAVSAVSLKALTGDWMVIS